MGYRRASPLALSPQSTVQGKTRGIPHLAKNERDTRISCTRFHPAQRVRLSSKESRMKFVSPHETPQEIRVYGAPDSWQGGILKSSSHWGRAFPRFSRTLKAR